MTPGEVREDHIRMLQQEVACMKGGASLSHEVYTEALDRCQRKNKVDWYADIDALLEDRATLVKTLRELLADCDADLKPMGLHPARTLLRGEGIDNKWLEDNAGMLQGHDHALERERDELKQQLNLFYERDPHKATSLVKINHELQQAKAEGDDLRQQIAFLEHFADPPDMRTGKTERQALNEKLGQFAPLIEILTEKHWDYRTAEYIMALESAIKYARALLTKYGR